MQLGLKNRLRLISIFPILILFSLATYYVYSSYRSFQSANHLQARLEIDKQLNDMINNISRERGMTVMYLGNASATTLKSLHAQRIIVDDAIKAFKSNDNSPQTLAIVTELDKLRHESRPSVDNKTADFDEIFNDVYGENQDALIKELSSLSTVLLDEQTISIANSYISLVRTNEYSSLERDYLTYLLSKGKALKDEELEKWITLIGNADSYRLESVTNQTLQASLRASLLSEDNTELLNDIVTERASIIRSSSNGAYDTQSGIWFAMISEKINAINEGEKILSNAMDSRASIVKGQSIQFLITAITIWIVSILVGILGVILSNEIAKNIKNLESVLKRVAEDTHDNEADELSKSINLDTAEGTAQAYALLERIIEPVADFRKIYSRL